MHLLLARHGETADNARRVFQGQAGSGLNRLGRAQAARLGERLSRSLTPPDVIIASDLDRAVETATIIATALGRTASDVERDKGLREVDVGTWTGKGYDEVSALFPEEWAAWESGLDIRRGGGETYGELANRIDDAIRGIAERHHREKNRILIVSHGGSIKSWISMKVLNASREGLRALAGVANAGLSAVERDSRGRHRLHQWNDIAHLEGLNVDEHTD